MKHLKESIIDKRKNVDYRLNFQFNKRQQIMPRNGAKYMILNKIIRNKCKQAKEEWLYEKCGWKTAEY